MKAIFYSRRLIYLIIIFIVYKNAANAQPNLPQYDEKKLHFGFTLAGNIGRMQLETKHDIMSSDSLRNVSVANFPGIGLGAITNFKLGRHWDVRLVAPVISFVQRNLIYDFDNTQKIVKVESAYCDGSLLIKYKSVRRKNTRTYVVAGPRFSYDFGSTKDRTRGIQNPVVSLNPFTYGWEVGVGMDIYFEYFKFSPEIKTSQTIGNALYNDNYIYTQSLQGLYPQLIQISLHFE
jgi:hypothetical protein